MGSDLEELNRSIAPICSAMADIHFRKYQGRDANYERHPRSVFQCLDDRLDIPTIPVPPCREEATGPLECELVRNDIIPSEGTGRSVEYFV